VIGKTSKTLGRKEEEYLLKYVSQHQKNGKETIPSQIGHIDKEETTR
jgi:hypothetical protein